MAFLATSVIDESGLGALIDTLVGDGWTVLGPTVVDGAIVHRPIATVDQLPRGVGDEQDAARYRLGERTDDSLFGYAVGPQSWKAQLFPSRELMRRAESGDGVDAVEPPLLALVGVRSCDLHAIAIHDRVLLDRVGVDVRYEARRARSFIVAITCSDPGGTCFCASMGTGPDPDTGFDLALTEVLDADGHRFLVRVGSDRGAALLDRIPSSPATDHDHVAASAVVDDAMAAMGRTLDTMDLRDLLHANAEHPQWDDVATRCLACGNCTLVCPTCFCTTVEDATDLVDGSTERWRVWDSCFTGEFSHLEAGNVRASTRARYRQWATHKLAAWWDQFGSSGCVGCGRCITWCPAAIDITAEVAEIRATSAASSPGVAHPREQ